MAIEDAVTLARCLAVAGIEPVRRACAAMRVCGGGARPGSQRASRMTGRIYHLRGPLAHAARYGTCARMGGAKLRERYDWLYDWRRV